MTKNTHFLNTQSFILELDEDLILKDIKCIDEKMSELTNDKGENVTSHALVVELAMNLYSSNRLLDEALDQIEKLKEEKEGQEDKISFLVSDNEMLRDELDETR